jgi:signal transduction histidine kinase
MTTEVNGEEQKRLLELYAYEILDTAAEEEFDAIVSVASYIAQVPISLISLIDLKRQWFKARVGLELTETSRDISFCHHALQQEAPLIVEDTLADARFAANPLVTNDPNLRFYAGFPLVTSKGTKLGTLCVLDKKPQSLTQAQMDCLAKLADQVINLFELRIKNKYLHQLTQQLENQKVSLRTLVDNQRKIMSILAHDTRGPLTSMQQLIELSVGDEEAEKELLPNINDQLKSTVQLLDNLINWGVVNMYSTEDEQYKASEAVEEVLKSFQKKAEEKGIRLTAHVNPGTTLPIKRDVLLFVLRNLVQNAIKYTETGSVCITVDEKMSTPFIEVADTGIGMPDAVKEKLFVHRLGSRAGTRNEKGAGVGLLLLHDFVRQSGGKIVVESRPDEGTSVTITFEQAGQLSAG